MLTDEAPVGKNESCTNPHALTKGLEPASDQYKIVRFLGAIGNVKASCLHLFLNGLLAGEAGDEQPGNPRKGEEYCSKATVRGNSQLKSEAEGRTRCQKIALISAPVTDSGRGSKCTPCSCDLCSIPENPPSSKRGWTNHRKYAVKMRGIITQL
jgi:hypothetical protein